MINLPRLSGEMTDLDELRSARAQHWLAASDRGHEVLTYDEGFQVLEHPGLLKGPTFQYRLDQMHIDGEARRFFDMTVPNSEGEYRKRLRAPLAALFRPLQVKKLREAVRAITREAVQDIAASGPVDLMEQLCWLVPSRTYCHLVSIPLDRAPDVRRIGDDTLGVILTVDWSRRQLAMDTVLEGVEMIREHLSARRADLGDDFTSAMIRQQESGVLTEEELFAEAFSILQASVDNTAHQIGNTFGALLDDRTRWESFLADRSLAAPLIEESIRLYPRFGTVFRFVPEEVEIAGDVLPADSWIFVSTRMGQRDPAVWDDPDAFRADRAAMRPLMFGAGPYNCLGQTLARMEIEESLLAVADAYPDVALAEPWIRRDTNAVTETKQLVVSV